MSRKRVRKLPSNPSTPSSPVDLFLVAGLPNPQHTRAEGFLKEIAGQSSKVITVASGMTDGSLYRGSNVDSLLRGGSEFASRRFHNRGGAELPMPRRISLLYVPAADTENLLSAFDFFVFPIPMRDLSIFDCTGRQKRHDWAACKKAIADAFGGYRHDLLATVQRRIESRHSSEPLLLPPTNFHTTGGRLERAFSELARGTRAWDSAIPEGMATELFDHEKLPHFLREQEHQEIYRDSRDVIFPCARANEMHGRLTELKNPAAPSDLQYFLRGIYRFGTPLPEGFHHDAQLQDGRHFNKMEFVCTRAGRILVSGTHANVYPNDYVRPVS